MCKKFSTKKRSCSKTIEYCIFKFKSFLLFVNVNYQKESVVERLQSVNNTIKKGRRCVDKIFCCYFAGTMTNEESGQTAAGHQSASSMRKFEPAGGLV